MSQRTKKDRRKVAEELAAERAKRTPQQQLARLDQLLGEGVGAKKERARLLKQIEEQKGGKKEEQPQ